MGIVAQVFDPLQTHGGCNYSLLRTDDAIELFGLNLNPPYQRDHVWTNEQRGRFVGHMLEGGIVGPIICNAEIRDAEVNEVVDGKQRLTAMSMWASGEIDAILSDGFLVHVNDLDLIDKRKCSMQVCFRLEFVQLDKVGVLRLYLKLNRGGTVHSSAEIEKVERMLRDME